MENQNQSMNKVKEVENDVLNYDKMYFLNVNKYTRAIAKLSLFAILGMALINFMLQDLVWWVKGLFGLGALFLVIFVYYDIKYIMGLKKNPFMIFPEKRVFRYYNEFEGNKEIEITQIREIKVFSRANGAFLLEIFLHNQKKEENVNIAGYDQQTIQEIIKDLRSLNPNFELTSNKTETQKRKKNSK